MTMQRVLHTGTMVQGELTMSNPGANGQREDDLGFAAALRIAIPVGLGLWALAIYAAIHFLT
jgi:hypothetical protein